MKIKTGEVVVRTELSRQTISRLAALGYIPGASRKTSGRWEFVRSPELDEWMAREGRVTRIRRRRQILHPDEADIRRLERKAAKLRTSPGSRHGRRRLVELTQMIAQKRAALSDYITARDLSKASGRSRRWVTGRARTIPGARLIQNKFAFEKSATLSEWIFRERRLRDVERKLMPGNIRFPRSRMAWILLQSFRYKRELLSEISRIPFEKWPKDERDEFAKEFRNMVREIQRVTGVTLNQS
jgi:hypothetical protein